MSSRGFAHPFGAPAQMGPGIWSPLGTHNPGYPIQFSGFPTANPAPGIQYQQNIHSNLPRNLAMTHQMRPLGHSVSHIALTPNPPQPTASSSRSSTYPTPVGAVVPFSRVISPSVPTLQNRVPLPVSTSGSSPISPGTMTFDTHQSAKICPYCHKTHSRPVRYEACENKHTGARPFLCGGQCGDATCTAAFHSKERLTHHLRTDEDTHVRCKHCGKAGWRQNAARHERSCHGGLPA